MSENYSSLNDTMKRMAQALDERTRAAFHDHILNGAPVPHLAQIADDVRQEFAIMETRRANRSSVILLVAQSGVSDE